MQRTLLSMLLAVSAAGVVGADDIMITGPKAEKVTQEILDLNKEMIKAVANGPAAGDYFDRYDVDSIIYLGALRENMTKAQVVNEWRAGARKMISQIRHNERVRVYDNGNVAVYDYIGDIVARYKGQDLTRRTHTVDVYVKHKGMWRTVAHHAAELPVSPGNKSD